MKLLKFLLQYTVPWLLVLLFGNASGSEENCQGFGCNNIHFIDISDGQISTDYEIEPRGNEAKPKTFFVSKKIHPSSYVYDDNMTSPCGGLLNGIEGTINYKSSLQYANNERCIWAIVTEPYQSKSIVITLSKYGLDADQHDKLYMMEITANNGSMLNSPKITNLIGEKTRVTAYGSHVYIVFYSDVSIQGKGFQLTYAVNENYFPVSTHSLAKFNFFHQQTGSVILNGSQPPVFQIVALTPAVSESQTDSVLELEIPIEFFCTNLNSAYLYTSLDGMFKKDEITCNNGSTSKLSFKERMALIVLPNDVINELSEPMEVRWETKMAENMNKSFVKTDANQCGGVIEAESGIVQYKPNRVYNNNEQCSWTIISKGHLNFKMVKNGFASGETLELMHVDFERGLISGLVDLSRLNQTHHINSSAAILIFTSDQNQTGHGFIVEFKTLPNTQTSLETYRTTHTSTKSGRLSYPSSLSSLPHVPHVNDEFSQTFHIFTLQTNSTENTRRTFDFQYGMFRKRNVSDNSCVYESLTAYEYRTRMLTEVAHFPNFSKYEKCQDVIAVSKLNPWFNIKSRIVFIAYKIYYPNTLTSFSWKERESEVASTACGGTLEGDFGRISYKEFTNYSNRERCNWNIKSKRPNGSIKFELEKSGFERRCDYIQIYNKYGSREAYLGNRDGRDEVVLQGSEFRVSFASYGDVKGQGFRISFLSS